MSKQQAANTGELTTESRNKRSEKIDTFDSCEIVRLMNGEDRSVVDAVASQANEIARAVDLIVESLSSGGRLIYMGAGTSGRLGVLDASECPPTFSTPPEMVIGLIAGGRDALTRSIEGAEDDPEDGKRDLQAVELVAQDIVVGIATSGRTPYVLGGLRYASNIPCQTIGLSCNLGSPLGQVANHMVVPVVGPEIISGSTRLKAGTATKMVLNMLTTATMVRLGKTFGNLMVDLTSNNQKLANRSNRIVAELTGLSVVDAARLLGDCDGEVKTAVVSNAKDVAPAIARRMLNSADGHLRVALKNDESE